MAPLWKTFERYVQQLLRLDSTPGSGNQFYARGDAVDTRHPAQTAVPMLADCKCTEKGSFSLNHAFLLAESERADYLGQRFVIPIRFITGSAVDDYIVLRLNDFAELLDLARRTEEVP